MINIKVVSSIIILTAIGLSVPVVAQIQRPSQDFFNQGREQLEREIQVIQSESSNSPQNPQKPQSQPILEVSPSPTSDAFGGSQSDHRHQQPTQLETPNPTPTTNQVKGTGN